MAEPLCFTSPDKRLLICETKRKWCDAIYLLILFSKAELSQILGYELENPTLQSEDVLIAMCEVLISSGVVKVTCGCSFSFSSIDEKVPKRLRNAENYCVDLDIFTRRPDYLMFKSFKNFCIIVQIKL